MSVHYSIFIFNQPHFFYKVIFMQGFLLKVLYRLKRHTKAALKRTFSLFNFMYMTCVSHHGVLREFTVNLLNSGTTKGEE